MFSGKFNHSTAVLVREQLRGVRRGLRTTATVPVLADGAARRPSTGSSALPHRTHAL